MINQKENMNLNFEELELNTFKATKRLIDSVWTVTYRYICDDKVEIISFNRKDEYGYKNEKKLERCNLIEGEGRILKQLILSPYVSFRYRADLTHEDARVYEVINPKNVFDY